MAGETLSENEQFIQHELETGAYGTREELIDEAVSLLKRRGDFKREIKQVSNRGHRSRGMRFLQSFVPRLSSFREAPDRGGAPVLTACVIGLAGHS